MAFDAGALIANLQLSTKGFVTGLASAETAIKGVAKQSNVTATSMTGLDKASALLSTTMGKTLAIGAVGGLVLGFKKTVDAAGDLEKSMANVATLVDTNIVNIQGLTQEVLAMTTEVNKSSEDLSSGLYQVFSAGITDASEAMDVLKASAIAATAGLSDTRTSVDAITTVINAYGLAASEATHVSDLMFQTVRLGKTTFGELASSIGTVIAPASALGIKLEDLFAAIATLTKGGIDTRIAMTALRATFFSVLKPSDEALQTAKELGLEFDATALRTKGLVGFMNDLKEATKGNTELMSKLIPETRAVNAVLALTGDQSQELNRIMGEMNQVLGTTQEAFKKQEATYDEQAKKLGLLVDRVQIKIGNIFLPAITSMLKGTLSFFVAIGDEIDALWKKLKPPMPVPVVSTATIAQMKAAAEAIGKPFNKLTEEDLPKFEAKLKEMFGTVLPKITKDMADLVKTELKKIEDAGIKTANEFGKAWSKTTDEVKDAFEKLGVVPKEQIAGSFREIYDAFDLLTTKEDLSQREVLQLREGLFNKLKELSENTDENIIALGFDPEKVRESVEKLHQQLLDGTRELVMGIQEEGNTVTVTALTQVKSVENLVAETLDGVEGLINGVTNTQVNSFNAIMNDLETYRSRYISAEQEITAVVEEEMDKRAASFDRFVLDAENKWRRFTEATIVGTEGGGSGENITNEYNQSVTIYGPSNPSEVANATTRNLDKFNASTSY